MKVERVPYADHPHRCKVTSFAQGNKGEQCWFVAQPNLDYCILHGRTPNTNSLSMYKLTVFQARLEEMMQEGEKNPVLGLRNEIALLRTKLEAILNECKGPSDLIIHSQKINFTVQLIGKLVVEAKRLESSLGHLLDKSTVLVLCDNIVSIVAGAIEGVDGATDILEKIAREVGASIERAVMKRVEAESE